MQANHSRSASSAHRWTQCGASIILPRDEREPGDKAKRGTASHEYVHDVLTGVPADVALANNSHPKTVGKIKVDQLKQLIGDSIFHSEIAFQYNPVTETTTTLKLESARGYPKDPALIYGTADLVIERPIIEVLDVKTGQSVGQPSQNWQMLTLGLMVARLYKMSEVNLGILYLDGKGNFSLDMQLVGAMDLDAAADAMREAMRMTLPVVGDHCEWCPSSAYCEVIK